MTDQITTERVDDVDAKAAGADAEQLAMKDPEVQMATATMLAARQLYAAASQELERRCNAGYIDQPDGTKRSVHPMVAEIITQAVARAATEPFASISLFEGFTHQVLPWFQKLVERQTKTDITERQQQALKDETARRATTIPCLPIDAGHNGELVRGTALVLVGYGPAVQYILNYITVKVLAAVNELHPRGAYTVVRFLAEPEAKLDLGERLAVVGRRYWGGAAEIKNRFIAMLQSQLGPQLKAQPDLLVVDDLAAAVGGIQVDGIVSGGAAPYACATAHKKLSAWTKDNFMGMVAGVPCTSFTTFPDLTCSPWEQLRTHTILRPVTVIHKPCPGHEDLEEGMVRLVVGDKACQFDVEPSAIESANKLIV